MDLKRVTYVNVEMCNQRLAAVRVKGFDQLSLLYDEYMKGCQSRAAWFPQVDLQQLLNTLIMY